MKYFEFNEPFFALIRAEDTERASTIFENMSGGKHHPDKERTRNEALNMFLNVEIGTRSDLINAFNDSQDKSAILLVDGGIL
ncbi:hypothetical protein EPH95_02815 [Salicibibacter halophilus]|uniref:Uncharacterized protein n=1 Tax=Salicibibacter halophilus TaxID=2502791 RepID=A0A514LEF1_9BACI|nr:hypothetical protein [Salicibibacter halophilus]QDI90233.1 hypothetical protein EPH95_02815 [Salicibibacter halophilus]